MEWKELKIAETVFQYCDYYAAHRGRCPECGLEVHIDLLNVKTVDSDGEADVVCPVCGEEFICKLF